MSHPNYYSKLGVLPSQTDQLSNKAVFTAAYAVIPRAAITDMVTSVLPHWTGARASVLSRPLSGFSETFSQYLMEVQPGGGSDRPEPDKRAEAALFLVDGEMTVEFDTTMHNMRPGSFAYIPAGAQWRLRSEGTVSAKFHWIRKAFQEVDGLAPPPAIFTHEEEHLISWMPDAADCWGTTRFIDPADVRYDMHLNIVTFEPGAKIPFMETHVMEHGLYVLEGKALYRLNQDWIEVEAGDFMWLRSFCPQACYAGGTGRFRYLLYKDVNRHMKLW